MLVIIPVKQGVQIVLDESFSGIPELTVKFIRKLTNEDDEVIVDTEGVTVSHIEDEERNIVYLGEVEIDNSITRTTGGVFQSITVGKGAKVSGNVMSAPGSILRSDDPCDRVIRLIVGLSAQLVDTSRCPNVKVIIKE